MNFGVNQFRITDMGAFEPNQEFFNEIDHSIGPLEDFEKSTVD